MKTTAEMIEVMQAFADDDLELEKLLCFKNMKEMGDDFSCSDWELNKSVENDAEQGCW